MADAKAIFRGEIRREELAWLKIPSAYLVLTVEKADESGNNFEITAKLSEPITELHGVVTRFYKAIENANALGVSYDEASKKLTVNLLTSHALIEAVEALSEQEEEKSPSLLDALDAYEQIIELAQGFRTRVKSAGFSDESAEEAALNLLNQLIIVSTTQNSKEA